MTNSLEDEINRIVESMDNQENQEQEQDTQTPQDGIQDIYVLVVREHEEEGEPTQVVESAAPNQVKKPFEYVTLSIALLCCLSMLGSIAFQLYVLLNPPVATVTIIPKTQQFTLNGTLQLGRLLSPFTTASFKVSSLQPEQSSPEQTGYRLPPAKMQSYRQATRRVMDKSPYQHMPSIQARVETYRHTTSIKPVALHQFLRKIYTRSVEDRMNEHTPP